LYNEATFPSTIRLCVGLILQNYDFLPHFAAPIFRHSLSALSGMVVPPQNNVYATALALQQALRALRRQLGPEATVGFVPTMGALHAGHISLVERARRENTVVVASVFVNPTQFGPNEDLAAYPRRHEADQQLLWQAGADVLFFPTPQEMYPPDAELHIGMTRLSTVADGASRPGHFDGVALVVTKLLNLVGCDRLYLGRKDYQQFVLLRKMAAEQFLPVEVIGCATLRDSDGLALSSRNEYLSPTERGEAPFLYQVLSGIRQQATKLGTAAAAIAWAQQQFAARPAWKLDYIQIRHGRTFAEVTELQPQHEPVALAAAWLGRTRLIDNINLFEA
jgi:pantoate--beta-alanine ligase